MIEIGPNLKEVYMRALNEGGYGALNILSSLESITKNDKQKEELKKLIKPLIPISLQDVAEISDQDVAEISDNAPCRILVDIKNGYSINFDFKIWRKLIHFYNRL